MDCRIQLGWLGVALGTGIGRWSYWELGVFSLRLTKGGTDMWRLEEVPRSSSCPCDIGGNQRIVQQQGGLSGPGGWRLERNVAASLMSGLGPNKNW